MGQAYTDALREKHRKLEGRIEAEAHRPVPDNVRLHALKKEKLKLKDEMLAAG